MACELCEQYRIKYPLRLDEEGELVHFLEEGYTSSPIRCAFEESSVFSSDNWCCQTMSLLRRGLQNPNSFTVWNNDSNAGCFGIPLRGPDQQHIQQGFLVMSWYKNRGRTGMAIVLWDESEPVKLTLPTAQFIIQKLKLESLEE